MSTCSIFIYQVNERYPTHAGDDATAEYSRRAFCRMRLPPDNASIHPIVHIARTHRQRGAPHHTQLRTHTTIHLVYLWVTRYLLSHAAYMLVGWIACCSSLSLALRVVCWDCARLLNAPNVLPPLTPLDRSTTQTAAAAARKVLGPGHRLRRCRLPCVLLWALALRPCLCRGFRRSCIC